MRESEIIHDMAGGGLRWPEGSAEGERGGIQRLNEMAMIWPLTTSKIRGFDSERIDDFRPNLEPQRPRCGNSPDHGGIAVASRMLMAIYWGESVCPRPRVTLPKTQGSVTP